MQESILICHAVESWTINWSSLGLRHGHGRWHTVVRSIAAIGINFSRVHHLFLTTHHRAIYYYKVCLLNILKDYSTPNQISIIYFSNKRNYISVLPNSPGHMFPSIPWYPCMQKSGIGQGSVIYGDEGMLHRTPVQMSKCVFLFMLILEFWVLVYYVKNAKKCFPWETLQKHMKGTFT